MGIHVKVGFPVKVTFGYIWKHLGAKSFFQGLTLNWTPIPRDAPATQGASKNHNLKLEMQVVVFKLLVHLTHQSAIQ